MGAPLLDHGKVKLDYAKPRFYFEPFEPQIDGVVIGEVGLCDVSTNGLPVVKNQGKDDASGAKRR